MPQPQIHRHEKPPIPWTSISMSKKREAVQFRMQFPWPQFSKPSKNGRIPTIRFHILKYSRGNCMRNLGECSPEGHTSGSTWHTGAHSIPGARHGEHDTGSTKRGAPAGTPRLALCLLQAGVHSRPASRASRWSTVCGRMNQRAAPSSTASTPGFVSML